MSDTPSNVPVADLRDDAEARLSFLVGADVIDVDEDDAVTATEAFADTRAVYADTYQHVDDDTFAETIADLFGVTVDEARTRIRETDLTREDLVTYLSLQSHLDRDLPQDVVVLLTSMVSGVGFGSAVPESMPELGDDTYAEFVAEHGDAVVVVWSYPCNPCRSLKRDLPAFRDVLPERVAIGGVDGDSAGRLRQEFDVTSAPTLLFFAGGDLAESFEGYLPVEALSERVESVYGG
jgi:thiol-disulfide isomerase/thioredoxin